LGELQYFFKSLLLNFFFTASCKFSYDLFRIAFYCLGTTIDFVLSGYLCTTFGDTSSLKVFGDLLFRR